MSKANPSIKKDNTIRNENIITSVVCILFFVLASFVTVKSGGDIVDVLEILAFAIIVTSVIALLAIRVEKKAYQKREASLTQSESQ